MTIKAIVSSTDTQTRAGKAKSTGNDYRITQQSALVELPNGERRVHNLSLDDGQLPLQPGTYVPMDSAFQFKGYDIRVSDRARDWKPVTAVAAPPKAG